MNSGKSLARELTYDPRLQQIVQTPVHELRELRSKAPVGSIAAGTEVQPGQELPLYGKAAGNASDTLLLFQLPKAVAGLFGLTTMGIVPADGSTGDASAFANGAAKDPYSVFVGVYYTPPTAAQRVAGKYNLTTTVGGKRGQLWLLTNETELTVEVFTDISVVEVYWQGGRSVTTGSGAGPNKPGTHTPLPLPSGTVRGGISVYNNVSATLQVQADIWTMGSIWATKEEVLATPRASNVAYSVGN